MLNAYLGIRHGDNSLGFSLKAYMSKSECDLNIFARPILARYLFDFDA